MNQLDIDILRARLSETLPGTEAHSLMMPSHRKLVSADSLLEGSFKPGAVLVLLCYDKSKRYFIPLIQRFSYEGHHSGQVALPGGKPESGDADLQETALRECFEEIGLGHDVEVLGGLSPLYISVSGFLVHPFVAVYKKEVESFVPHEREVEEVLKFFLDELLDEKNKQIGEVQLPGGHLEAPYFALSDKRVWGATAMILSEFREVLRSIS
ncbi:MAG TPA: CoA pyrophosphatase [Bacteroidia bacterium]|nr:CoA pyrophosphatase [Bacteroidia bacterium]